MYIMNKMFFNFSKNQLLCCSIYQVSIVSACFFKSKKGSSETLKASTLIDVALYPLIYFHSLNVCPIFSISFLLYLSSANCEHYSINSLEIKNHDCNIVWGDKLVQ